LTRLFVSALTLGRNLRVKASGDFSFVSGELKRKKKKKNEGIGRNPHHKRPKRLSWVQ
jgi:hypothetical protein